MTAVRRVRRFGQLAGAAFGGWLRGIAVNRAAHATFAASVVARYLPGQRER